MLLRSEGSKMLLFRMGKGCWAQCHEACRTWHAAAPAAEGVVGVQLEAAVGDATSPLTPRVRLRPVHHCGHAPADLAALLLRRGDTTLTFVTASLRWFADPSYDGKLPRRCLMQSVPHR